MTVQEIAMEIMANHLDEYAVESYEEIPMVVPKKRNHKRRIQKKWLKRYGQKLIYIKKKCKKIDVTIELIADFCMKYNYPMPQEILDFIE